MKSNAPEPKVLRAWGSSIRDKQERRCRVGPFSTTRNLGRAFGSEAMKWLEDPETVALLRRIVSKATPDVSLHEELLQEALIHFWRDAERHPGNSRSWYLQSCKFHVENYLRTGRSLDSPKRCNGKLSLSDEMVKNSERGRLGDPDLVPDADGDVLSTVAEHEILRLLSDSLSSRDLKIVDYLAQGLGVREIASKLKMSHTAIVKRRLKIAEQARRLGLAPPSPMSDVAIGRTPPPGSPLGRQRPS